MPKIYLYAEILTHIRQLSLHASLQTAKAEGTKVDVSTDKKVITVIHDGEVQKLYLPTQISGTAQVVFPIKKETEISARVQIDDEHEWKCNVSNEIEAPWMASDLTSQNAIQCRQCHVSILAANVIGDWKALPSENWAELMDFWFCHKPHEESDSAEDAAQAKGFSSKSKLAVAGGTGMADLTSIVLHESDCQNIEINAEQDKGEKSMLHCEKCQLLLGTANQSEGLVRLSKASISVNSIEDATTFEHYPASVFICAQILSLIESTALKRFVVHTSVVATGDQTKVDTTPLILWIFNPDIYYSCSAYDGSALTPSVTRSAEVLRNPHGDDISQIYGEAATDKQPKDTGSEEFRVDAKESQQLTDTDVSDQGDPVFSNGSRMNGDDTSQIFGSTNGTPTVAGEVEIEVPVSASADRRTEPSSRAGIEPIADSETPFVSARSGQKSDDTHPSRSNTSEQPRKPPNEHVNLVHRATKIFYKPLPADESPPSFLDSNSTTHEELYLSDPAEFAELCDALNKSNKILPASAKVFQDWKVGLLDRYEKVPSGLGVMQENPLARGIKAKDGRVTRWSLGNGAEGLYA